MIANQGAEMTGSPLASCSPKKLQAIAISLNSLAVNVTRSPNRVGSRTGNDPTENLHLRPMTTIVNTFIARELNFLTAAHIKDLQPREAQRQRGRLIVEILFSHDPTAVF